MVDENIREYDENRPFPNTPEGEADTVLESLPGGALYLDGFSLLQVIANPRGNPEDLFSSASPVTPTSFHGRYGSTNTGSVSATTDLLTGTFHQLESTVVQVTEQMELLNSVLEGWSRQLLEEDPFGSSSGGEDIPEAQLRELPQSLQSLSLNDLQSYLERSGVLAHAFRERQPLLERNADVEDPPTPTVLAILREHIPEVFWDTSSPVDLTDYDTFREVFLASDPAVTTEKVGETASVFNFFPLVPEDSLSPWLDQIELALLEAVREKSSEFFVESVRFGKLQQEIHSLLTQVQQAQSDVAHVQENVVHPSINLPRLDEERLECQKLLLVLDQVQDLLQAKASIPGYVSAADDLTALEQVQYGRKQLTEYHDGDNGDADDGTDPLFVRRRPLSNLTALHGVAKQLDQYQDLIVTNLRDELVEVFMDWKPASIGLPPNHERIQDIVRALHKCHGWDSTWQAYRNRLHDVLRLTMRTIVGEFSSSPTSTLTVQAFLECLDVTNEQFMSLLQAAVAVKAYCLEHGVFNPTGSIVDAEQQNTEDEDTAKSSEIEEKASGVVISSAELAAKSVSELLRLRKEAHSLVSLDEMKLIWDKCSSFASQLEELTGAKAATMRSALLAQAKAFAERQHETQMSALAAALDSERWTQCQVSADRQEKIARLCSGRAILSRAFNTLGSGAGGSDERKPDVLVGGVYYKVVWSCLLLVEMVMNDLSAAAHFNGLSTLMVTKVCELLRLFNVRTTQLVLGAGAIHSTAKLKSINAKHLALVTQCLGMVIAIFPHIRAALMAHLPPKQHMLLNGMDAIKKEFAEHNEKVLNKFVTIIGGIVEHGLAPKLAGTDFDVRAEQIPLGEDGTVPSCVFFEGVSVNTKKMHQVLFGLLPPDHLQDVFSRIFAFIDQKVPTIIVQASRPQISTSAGSSRSPQRQTSGPKFTFPTTDAGKRRLLLEAEAMTMNLNALDGVQPWDFSTVNILENRVEYSLRGDHAISVTHTEDDEEDIVTNSESKEGVEAASEDTVGEEKAGNADAKEPDDPKNDVERIDSDKSAAHEGAEETDDTVGNMNGATKDETSNQTRDSKDIGETSVGGSVSSGPVAGSDEGTSDEIVPPPTEGDSSSDRETKEMDSEAETDVTTDPGDSEDAQPSPDVPTVASGGAICSIEEQVQDPKIPDLEEVQESPIIQSTDAPNGETVDEEGSRNGNAEYPAEVTAL